MYTIEISRDGQVIEQVECSTVDSAKEVLSVQRVNRYRASLKSPDRTGYLPADEARYARQCEELGIENVYC